MLNAYFFLFPYVCIRLIPVVFPADQNIWNSPCLNQVLLNVK